MVAVVLELVLLSLTKLRFGDILFISLVVTVLAYLIGDILILRYTNNIAATIADIGISLLTIYLFNYAYIYITISFRAALVSSLVLGIGEFVFHKYVVRTMHWSEQERTIS